MSDLERSAKPFSRAVLGGLGCGCLTLAVGGVVFLALLADRARLQSDLSSALQDASRASEPLAAGSQDQVPPDQLVAQFLRDHEGKPDQLEVWEVAPVPEGVTVFRVRSPSYCGSAGCTDLLYERDPDGSFREVLRACLPGSTLTAESDDSGSYRVVEVASGNRIVHLRAGAEFRTDCRQLAGPEPSGGTDSAAVALPQPLEDQALAAARAVAEARAAIDTAYGKNRPFAIQGRVTVRSEGQVALFGRALPGPGFRGALGSHWDEACLLVSNPEALGTLGYDRYVAQAAYYLGETQGTNQFGGPVACSRYGPMPAEVREKLGPLEQRLDSALEEFRGATASERQEISRLEKLLDELTEERSRLESEHRAAQRRVVAREDDGSLAQAYRALQALYPRQDALGRRLTATRRYLDLLANGHRNGTLEALIAALDREDASERAARAEGAAAALRREIVQAELKLEGLKSQLAADQRIHDDNLRVAREHGSDTSRQTAHFNESKRRLLEQIGVAEDALRRLREKARSTEPSLSGSPPQGPEVPE